jgi:hypothetical protein
MLTSTYDDSSKNKLRNDAIYWKGNIFTHLLKPTRYIEFVIIFKG